MVPRVSTGSPTNPPSNRLIACDADTMYVVFCIPLGLWHVRGSIVVSISACHAEDPGSIPGRGVYSSVWLLARSRPCRLQSCTLSELKIPMCRQVPVELSAQQAVPPALATWVSSDTLCTDARAWPRSAQLCTRAACLPAEQHGYPSDSYAAHN